MVRHGETAYNRDRRLVGWTDLPLTVRGRRQACVLRPRLAGVRFTGVWSSDLMRARETARLAYGEAVADARLRELDFGRLEGAVWDELEPTYREAFLAFEHLAAPGGETSGALRARVLDFVGTLLPGRHLVFTHGGVIRTLLREIGDEQLLVTNGSLFCLDWEGRRLM